MSGLLCGTWYLWSIGWLPARWVATAIGLVLLAIPRLAAFTPYVLFAAFAAILLSVAALLLPRWS